MEKERAELETKEQAHEALGSDGRRQDIQGLDALHEMDAAAGGNTAPAIDGEQVEESRCREEEQ
jgi:hypothetical protein